MKSKKKKRIVRYKKGVNLNVGLVIIVAFAIYLAINCFIYITREKVTIYEVTKGECSLLQNISTTGIILRKEEVTNAPASGYINYYVKDGKRVAVGNTLYSIDENGDFSDRLESLAENSEMLSAENLREIKSDIQKFVLSYDAANFSEVYDFKYNLDATLIEDVNVNAFDAINQTIAANGGSTLSLNKADKSGIVEFYFDGYEGLTLENIKKDSFDKTNYKKKIVNSGSSVAVGSEIYKTITDENWKVVIPLTDSQKEAYKDTSVVNVYFPTEDIKTPAIFSIINNDGENYAVLDFKRYMMRFAGTRFVELQIVGESVKGLKIPKTALTEKEFYTIPLSYLTTGGETNAEGFNKEIISDGETLVNFVEAEIICKKNDLCYIATGSKLNKGDVVVQPDTNEKYQIQSKAELKGVYNVNTGYTTFRYVEVISEKNGYYIVQSGSNYGLQVYDQIVLNSSMVKENQVIFK